MWKRLFAALSLFVLSPLIAEYLLGSLPMSMITILPIMALMYGSAAVFIREIVRRTGRGWVSLILLATAYGFLEEGLVTQSLWNPNYLHLRLLDYGFIPFLGTGAPWLIYVIGLHVFWSIGTPIALTESLFPKQRHTPWLHIIGVGLFALLCLGGSALIAMFTYKQLPFMASSAQLAGSVAVIVALVIAAFVIPKPAATSTTPAPHARLIFLVALVCGSGFVGAEMWAPQLHWSWPAATAAMVAFVVAALAFFALARGRTWSGMQRFALMAGGLGVYLWLGFIIGPQLHPEDPIAAHIALAGCFVALLGLAAWRARGSAT